MPGSNLSGSLPPNASETTRNGALNSAETPSRALIEDGQIVLGNTDDRCRVGASRMAALAHESSRGRFSFATVGRISGREAVAVTRAFDVEDPSSALRCLAALLLLDSDRVWLRGVCRLFGGDFVERPKLTKEQKYDLLIETLHRHGKPGEAYITEAFGEAAP